MNKADLTNELFARRGGEDIMTKAATERIVTDVLDIIKEGIATEGEARFAGFGTFSIGKRSARDCINPQTHEKMRVKAKKVPKFSPAQELKDMVAKSKVKV